MRAIKQRKDVNFEINLMPFISVLSICITILLTISVFVLIGKMNLIQSTGASQSNETINNILIVYMEPSKIWLQVKNGSSTEKNNKYELTYQQSEWQEKLKISIQNIKSTKAPLDTSIVLSHANVSYENIVNVLEALRSQGITKLGLSSM